MKWRDIDINRWQENANNRLTYVERTYQSYMLEP